MAEHFFQNSFASVIKLLSPGTPAGDRSEALASITPDEVTGRQASQKVLVGHVWYWLAATPGATVTFEAQDRAMPVQ